LVVTLKAFSSKAQGRAVFDAQGAPSATLG
jgi:hypothetical protein